MARTFETLVISRTDQELVLNAPALARKSIIVQTELIREAIASFEVGEQSLSFGHLKSVADLLAKQVSGRQVKLPAGVTAQMLYDRLVFSMSTEESPRKDSFANRCPCARQDSLAHQTHGNRMLDYAVERRRLAATSRKSGSF